MESCTACRASQVERAERAACLQELWGGRVQQADAPSGYCGSEHAPSMSHAALRHACPCSANPFPLLSPADYYFGARQYAEFVLPAQQAVGSGRAHPIGQQICFVSGLPLVVLVALLDLPARSAWHAVLCCCMRAAGQAPGHAAEAR